MNTNIKLKVLFILLLTYTYVLSQPSATNAQKVSSALKAKKELFHNSIVKNIQLKNIGPTVMSGRVVDIDVNPERPTEFYVAYASGGLWHTKNNGISFEPILDTADTQNVGDIAVDWKNNTIWVGTGENNSSRSSYAGIGILKSTDNGKTWKNMGLSDSHHIGRILIDPNNPNSVVVAVTGHLYSANEERGIYKTIDGGNTWTKTLYINNVSGIIDLAFAPNNFNIMFASAWEKDRKAWNFTSSGKGSSIYKSIDAGNNWIKVTTAQSGFPTGIGVGRIGIAVFDAHTVYAFLDNQYKRVKSNQTKKKSGHLTKDSFKLMSKEKFLTIEDKDLNDFLKTNGFQEKYRSQNLKQLVKNNQLKPINIAKYLENANALLFDTPVVGAEVYRSDDGGISWKKQNEDYIDDMYYSYGYYFGEIRIAPMDKEKIYIMGVPIVKSSDGGKTFTDINGDNVHADHQALWVNPKIPGHLIDGNDGGLNMSYDDGKNWSKLNSISVGQFYAINVDNQEPYHVYGGLQDNGVWVGPHNAVSNSRWHATGSHPWQSLIGGDGMQIQIDNRNHNLVYTGFQFGNYYRINKETKKKTYIQPKHDLGDAPYRFNWQTPILLSTHNQDILYLGGNKLHRSLNQGDNWESISPDLTKGGKIGNVAYGTLTTISESPFKFGLLYTGSDDGLIHISKDGGAIWEEIGKNLKELNVPEGLWVSRVVASKHKKERVYATLNGYRYDDFNTYIYVSEDYGNTWKNIVSNITVSPVNVVIEDPENENLLFAGTDNGLYVTFNKGNSWEVMQNGMPNVAVHDLVIQEEAKHLIIGTHGRSIYKADISILQKLNTQTLSKKLFVFKANPIQHDKNWGNASNSWREPNAPGLDISFYVSKASKCNVKIKTVDNITVSETELDAQKGINILSFDVAFSKEGKKAFLTKNKMKLETAENGKTYLPIGLYSFEIEANTEHEEITFEIE